MDVFCVPVDEHVVSSNDLGMTDLSGARMEEDVGLEVKPEEDMDKLKERLRLQLEYYFSKYVYLNHFPFCHNAATGPS